MEEQRYREDMELVLAKQFGFEDYDSFRTGVVKTIGKMGLKKLEKELDKYPRHDEVGASPSEAQNPPPPPPPPPDYQPV